MTDLVALDIGGTHARFALASVTSDGRIDLQEPVTLKTDDFASLQTAWAEFARRCDKPVPNAAAIAIAGPVTGETVRMTNNSWVLHTGALDEQLRLEKVTVINDFAAVSHAVARAPEDAFIHLTGPETPLPDRGTISVIGPGTGLGVAHFHRFATGYHVQATEGGHVDFPPIDHIDDLILQRLRQQHRRVSVERVVSGPGIVAIYEALAALEKRAVPEMEDRRIWQLGIDREDALATAAVDRFCLSLGGVAGDFALGHGASAVVIAGGLGYRLRERLPRSGFAGRFRFKGRYEQFMSSLPVKLIVHPQPGLFGAAAAFAHEHLGAA
ncbi:glucokinase [Altererythrobacter atlanticus]|uniref:Glucokinase n=1 Tax=Croceibacterium atlanticum TaxID=1267766 RepID=A0A0F7KTI4_9SPHN|nr:glucokinase [Croceibacterium atlanticum]AKH42557.1 Glucokinase [Croceibacterium atlanticum]MBB5731334.1 glucokinase [Croceibacterium atlanticum]